MYSVNLYIYIYCSIYSTLESSHKLWTVSWLAIRFKRLPQPNLVDVRMEISWQRQTQRRGGEEGEEVEQCHGMVFDLSNVEPVLAVHAQMSCNMLPLK